MTTTALKVKPYPGVQLVAKESIAKNEVEQALRSAQFKLDRLLHDLRSEFIVRENTNCAMTTWPRFKRLLRQTSDSPAS